LNFSNSPKRLLANSFLYEACLDWVKSFNAKPEPCVDAIAIAALHARYYHAGRFADGALENWALRLGSDECLQVASNKTTLDLNPRRESRTLHVVTEVYPIGGHTRVLAKWVLRDTSSDHGVVLTQQRGPLPEFFEYAIAKAGGALLCLSPTESAMSRASQLRSLSKEFDRVVLHSHPNDPVPILAFASADLPPVAMFNHAHFGFSLGTTVSDVVVNTLEYYENVSRKFRYARRTTRLTTLAGLTDLTKGVMDKESAKAQLGFDSSARLVMTMGHESCFRPIVGYNFFQTASKLLKTIPGIHLLIVGVPLNQSLVPSELVPEELRDESRCHFIGPVIDPERYYRAADICLESFPMPSMGAFLESVAYGEAFPVPVYGEGESILRPQLSPWLDGTYRPRDERDYIDYIARLVSDLPAAREHAHQLRLSMVQFDEDFGASLRKLNQAIDTMRHAPAEIPSSGMIDSYDSRMLAELMPLNLLTKIYELIPLDRFIRPRLLAAVMGLISPRTVAPIVTWLRKGSSLSKI
jgi:hypothetical protein